MKTCQGGPPMFKNMMNRYYYGKSGQGDYEKDDLPRNRMQLFWEMLRHRLSGLMMLNLVYAVIWIPAIIVLGRFAFSLLNLLEATQDPSILGLEAPLTGEQFMGYFHSSLLYTLLFLIPCIGITGPATAGLSYVTRNWARDEHAFAWSDYKDAIKANWKPALLNSFITGCVPALVYVCYTFYGQQAQSSFFFLIPQALVVLMGAIWMMMQMYIYPQIVTYTLNYGGVLRNSLLLTIGRLPQTVLFRLITLIPAALFGLAAWLLPYVPVVLMAFAGYYVLIGFALSRFVTASFTNGIFDKYINVNIEGAEVNRGLYKKDEFDEEDEEAEDDGE